MTAKKILVAEDDLSFQKLLLFKLKGAGYETLGVSRGDEVVKAFAEFKRPLKVPLVLTPHAGEFGDFEAPHAI